MQEYIQENSDILLPVITYMDWSSIRILMNTNRYMYTLKDNKALLEHISNTRLLPYVNTFSEYEQYVNLTYTEIYKLSLARGDIRLVKTLYRVIEKKLTYVVNAVEIATINGHYDIVVYLVENGHEILDSLYYAIKHGDKRIFDYLLSKGAKIGKYDIEEAIVDKQPEMAEYIFKKKGIISKYAITYAAYLGYNDLVKFLHKNGGDIGIALEVATKNGNDDLVKYLVKHTDYKALPKDGSLNSDQCMQFLIQNPLSFDGMRTKNSNFLNHSFSYSDKDNYELVRFTIYMMKLSGNIDMINFIDETGIIPCDVAFTRNNLDIAKLFVRNGAKGVSIDNILTSKMSSDIKRYLYSSYIGEISADADKEQIEMMISKSKEYNSMIGNWTISDIIYNNIPIIIVLIMILKINKYRYYEDTGIYRFSLSSIYYKELIKHLEIYLTFY